jgi:hypothetical protein
MMIGIYFRLLIFQSLDFISLCRLLERLNGAWESGLISENYTNLILMVYNFFACFNKDLLTTFSRRYFILCLFSVTKNSIQKYILAVSKNSVNACPFCI